MGSNNQLYDWNAVAVFILRRFTLLLVTMLLVSMAVFFYHRGVPG